MQMPQPHRRCSLTRTSGSNTSSPYCLFDLFLDLPHPSSSSSSSSSPNMQQSRKQLRHHQQHRHRHRHHHRHHHHGNGEKSNYGDADVDKHDNNIFSIGCNTTTATNNTNCNTNNNIHYCCNNNYDDGIARIIDPPPPLDNKNIIISSRSSSFSNELYSPTTIAQITTLAFPEYDETTEVVYNEQHHEQQQQQQQKEVNNRQNGHHHHLLSKYDIYQSDFIPHYHSFTIVLGSSDGSSSSFSTTTATNYGDDTTATTTGTKIFGHVRHYLPPLSTPTTTTTTATSRIDVGRRKYRAMVLLTRATGGSEFYSNILHTAEVIGMQSRIHTHHHRQDGNDDPIRLYLHALFQKHATLIAQYEELRRYGLGLNFLNYSHNNNNNNKGGDAGSGGDGGGGGGGSDGNTQHQQHEQQQQQQQIPTVDDHQPQSPSSNDNGTSSLTPCEAARLIMKENESLFRITLDGVEFGGSTSGGSSDNEIGNYISSWRTNPSTSDQGGKRPSKFNIARNNIIDKEKKDNNNNTHSINQIVELNDRLQFYLPHSLQPGYDALPSKLIPQDIAHPILPLLRCIKSKNFVRLLSALLCEVRIIFVSACVTRLSSCVRAASSSLAQGLLAWEYTCIPVVPPSMMKSVLCTEKESPYLVGILNNQASRVRQLLGKSILDVLYIHLDTNEVMTLNMANPRWTVPDLLKKMGGNNTIGSNQKSASECLVSDLDEILKVDQQILSCQENGTGTSPDRVKDSNGKRLEKSVPPATSLSDDLDQRKNSRRKSASFTTSVRHMSLLERREYASSVDAAAAFGKLIRSSFFVEAADIENLGKDEDEDEKEHEQRQILRDALMYSSKISNEDIERFVASSHVSEYEHGEECIRSALTTFFVHMFGDMGMYVSESHGAFLLDRRKFLLRKEQLGEREGSPTHRVLQKLSASRMFAAHARSRVEDMSIVVRDRSNIMPHHIPLFDVCSKFLTVHQLEFSLENVKRIVSSTVSTCTRHMAVERHDQVRSSALALTRENPLGGGGDGVKITPTLTMSDLINSCREYDTNLRAVMGVIWNRLHRSKKSRHILLTIELLTKLLTEGPLTAITEALDGLRIINSLKCFSDGKNGDANRAVGEAASHLYALLVDLPSLFAMRRHFAVAKTEVIPLQQLSWSNYIVSRLPWRVNSRALHSILRPPGMNVQRRILHDDDDSLDAVIAASSDDDASSIAALSRLRGEKGFPLYQEDLDDVDLDWMDHHFDELLNQSEPVSGSTGVFPEVGGEGITARDLFPDE